MNKLSLINDEDKKIITFKINNEIKQNLKKTLITSKNYNLKKKTDWVNEAIQMLKEIPDYTDLVLHADGSGRDFVFDKIYMSFKQRCFFADMRSEVVRAHPDIQGPQAAIIRAAILNRLMRNL